MDIASGETALENGWIAKGRTRAATVGFIQQAPPIIHLDQDAELRASRCGKCHSD